MYQIKDGLTAKVTILIRPDCLRSVIDTCAINGAVLNIISYGRLEVGFTSVVFHLQYLQYIHTRIHTRYLFTDLTNLNMSPCLSESKLSLFFRDIQRYNVSINLFVTSYLFRNMMGKSME